MPQAVGQLRPQTFLHTKSPRQLREKPRLKEACRCELACNGSSIRGAVNVLRCVQEMRIVRNHRKPRKLWMLIASKDRSPVGEGVQIEQFASQIVSKMVRSAGSCQCIDDGYAPGMVHWVLASHNRRPATLTCTCIFKLSARVKVALHQFVSPLDLALYEETVASAGSLDLRHHLSSWLNSVISIPGMTMNLQLSISRGSSSSGNWHETRQY